MVLEDKVCPESSFDEMGDALIIFVKTVLLLLPGKTDCLLNISSHGFTKIGPVILNGGRLWEVHQVSLNEFSEVLEYLRVLGLAQ